MRLLVFGTTGQVGRELARRAASHGVEVIAVGRDAADLCAPETCARLIAEAEADAVINAAAYTAVDKAESEPEIAQAVNAEAPGAMARAAARRHLPFLHISTDYVFDGTPGPAWREDDPTGPLGVYGTSKLAGEAQVRDAGGPHAILRTAWVFSAHGNNFLKTMLRLGAERDALRVVEDQRGGPTPAAAIADALIVMAGALAAGRAQAGTWHFTGAPAVSWADFARAIFAARGGKVPDVEGIPGSAWPTPARRPLNSVLDCTAIRRDFGIEQPDWREAVADVIGELA